MALPFARNQSSSYIKPSKLSNYSSKRLSQHRRTYSQVRLPQLKNRKPNLQSNDPKLKKWMKDMVLKSLSLGHDLNYIKSVMLKSRQKEKIERNLLDIKKNIRVIQMKSKSKRRGLKNSFLKANSSSNQSKANFSRLQREGHVGNDYIREQIDGKYNFDQKLNFSKRPSNFGYSVGQMNDIASVRKRKSKFLDDESNINVNLNGEGSGNYSKQDLDTISNQSGELEQRLEDMEPIERLKRNIARAEELKLMIHNDVDRKFIPMKSKWKKIRIQLRNRLRELTKMGVSLEEYKEHDIFPEKSYSRPGSYELIEACKMGDVILAKKLLTENPYIIYDYDHIGLTPMHWATKRNNFDIANLLLEYKPNLDAKDLLKRPPLYFAVLNKNPELLKALLLKRANPWSAGLKEDYIDICDKDARVVHLIQKFRNIEMLSSMSDLKKRQEIWDRETQILQYSVTTHK